MLAPFKARVELRPGSNYAATAHEDRARLLKAIDAVLAACYASDDGTEWEHNDGCEGEPTCPACWSKDIRAAVVAALKGEA
jgi:hypothetical protein